MQRTFLLLCDSQVDYSDCVGDRMNALQQLNMDKATREINARAKSYFAHLAVSDDPLLT